MRVGLRLSRARRAFWYHIRSFRSCPRGPRPSPLAPPEGPCTTSATAQEGVQAVPAGAENRSRVERLTSQSCPTIIRTPREQWRAPAPTVRLLLISPGHHHVRPHHGSTWCHSRAHQRPRRPGARLRGSGGPKYARADHLGRKPRAEPATLASTSARHAPSVARGRGSSAAPGEPPGSGRRVSDRVLVPRRSIHHPQVVGSGGLGTR